MNFIVDRVSQHVVETCAKPANLAKLWEKNPLSYDQLEEMINLVTLEMIKQNYREVETLSLGTEICIFDKVIRHDGDTYLNMLTCDITYEEDLDIDIEYSMVVYELINGRNHIDRRQMLQALSAKFGCQMGNII